MTPERLSELRSVLATLADSPITTLEAHPMPTNVDTSSGIPLAAASPLAQSLSQLITQTTKAGTTGGETLYRMVVPAKVAAQFGQGIVRSMTSKSASGGVHSALVSSTGIAAQASFVPVAGQAVAAGAVTAGALTIAAPLVFMAVAAGLSAHADRQRDKAIEHITGLLEQLHEEKLDDERNELNGCRDAIEAATAILLDRGRIGAALGLGPAVFAIDKAMATANHRLAGWEKKLGGLVGRPVELAWLKKAFPGLVDAGGPFHAHVEIARLAIAMKRRVLVLQAVEHGQLEGANHAFESFIRTLKESEQRVAATETGIDSLMKGLSSGSAARIGDI
ncbi:hypothetical protein [Mycobacterium sp. NPDC006124]|uniref:hypothetical protein n=1 Tax=Mycobacterium sp. NPDC006124 TaxID=3156729 RepID=UPI0033AA418D